MSDWMLQDRDRRNDEMILNHEGRGDVVARSPLPPRREEGVMYDKFKATLLRRRTRLGHSRVTMHDGKRD